MDEVGVAFLGIIKLVKEESEGMEAQGESTTMTKPKWDCALLVLFHVVLEEFDDFFPQTPPCGLPLVCQGYQFKIDLEDEVPSVH